MDAFIIGFAWNENENDEMKNKLHKYDTWKWNETKMKQIERD